MTTEQLRQYVKSNALNKIAFIYSDYWRGYQYDEESYSEQRDSEVRRIIKKMKKDLKAIKEGTFTKRQLREKNQAKH